MREIGSRVSEKVIRGSSDKWGDAIVVDYGNGKLISKNELYMPDGSDTTLDWENLADFNNKRGPNSTIRIRLANGLCGLLYELIKPLEEKGEFSEDMKKGFWYLINAGGIEASYGRASDAHGRRCPDVVTSFYPKREADAIAYAKYFFADSCDQVRPALMGLAANRDWKE
jgi:hypothetical protein